MVKYDQLVGEIYDCAANPELWTTTLTHIRDHVDAVYVLASTADLTHLAMGGVPHTVTRNSPWDVEWFQKLGPLMHLIPSIELIAQGEIDSTFCHSEHINQSDFEKSEFYRIWVEPQKLCDVLAVSYIKRPGMSGVLSVPRHRDKGRYTENETQIINALSPHIRRAMLINDLVDKSNLALALYRKVLDGLSVAVFLVGTGGRMAFTNRSGDAMLMEKNFLRVESGVLSAGRLAAPHVAFEDAVSRGVKGDAALGTAGIGVPLIGLDGDRAAAYVLPITGNDLRGELGGGHAAVFVTRRGEQQPMAIEILRTVFDLTPAEARISILIAKGDGPAAISESLGVSVSTIRTHLGHIFQKTGSRDQLALSSLVNELMPPIA